MRLRRIGDGFIRLALVHEGPTAIDIGPCRLIVAFDGFAAGSHLQVEVRVLDAILNLVGAS